MYLPIFGVRIPASINFVLFIVFQDTTSSGNGLVAVQAESRPENWEENKATELQYVSSDRKERMVCIIRGRI